MPTEKNKRRRRLRRLRHIFRFHGLCESAKLAAKGISYLFLYHRNMRIIFIGGAAAMLLAVAFKLQGLELVALCISITLVFTAEIFNTAIELMLDMSTRKYHPLVKLVKDIAAGVVLIACFNALAVGFILFIRRILR